MKNNISPQLKYYRKNREKILAERRRKSKDSFVKDKQYESTKRWRANNKEKFNLKMREGNARYRLKYPEKVQEKVARQYKDLKLRIFAALGGAFCKKCGFSDYRALQIDHINGGGNKHRKSFSSNKTYLNYVINNTEGFQVLCANCNCIKRTTNNELRKKENYED